MLETTIAELHDLFERSIMASSIAEPLASLDADEPPSKILQFLEKHGFDVVGIRQDGLVQAYVHIDELKGASDTLEAAMPIGPERTVPASGSLLEAVRKASADGFVFVTSLGQPTGIITRADLNKPPVRMWLFSLVTLLEMEMLRLIRATYPGEEWRVLLKAQRIKKVEQLFEDRQRRNEYLDLADCLQFCDKKEIICKSPGLWPLFGESRENARAFLRDCEQLRNEVVHIQELTGSSWTEAIDLAGRIEATLSRLERERSANS
ncbi:MAG: hypothetical protein QMC94_00835 [Anaerosomatales bacterium]|nr:hypothetical protein [Anaerosomatales bacterium]